MVFQCSVYALHTILRKCDRVYWVLSNVQTLWALCLLIKMLLRTTDTGFDYRTIAGKITFLTVNYKVIQRKYHESWIHIVFLFQIANIKQLCNSVLFMKACKPNRILRMCKWIIIGRKVSFAPFLIRKIILHFPLFSNLKTGSKVTICENHCSN